MAWPAYPGGAAQHLLTSTDHAERLLLAVVFAHHPDAQLCRMCGARDCTEATCAVRTMPLVQGFSVDAALAALYASMHQRGRSVCAQLLTTVDDVQQALHAMQKEAEAMAYANWQLPPALAGAPRIEPWMGQRDLATTIPPTVSNLNEEYLVGPLTAVAHMWPKEVPVSQLYLATVGNNVRLQWTPVGGAKLSVMVHFLPANGAEPASDRRAAPRVAQRERRDVDVSFAPYGFNIAIAGAVRSTSPLGNGTDELRRAIAANLALMMQSMEADTRRGVSTSCVDLCDVYAELFPGAPRTCAWVYWGAANRVTPGPAGTVFATLVSSTLEICSRRGIPLSEETRVLYCMSAPTILRIVHQPPVSDRTQYEQERQTTIPHAQAVGHPVECPVEPVAGGPLMAVRINTGQGVTRAVAAASTVKMHALPGIPHVFVFPFAPLAVAQDGWIDEWTGTGTFFVPAGATRTTIEMPGRQRINVNLAALLTPDQRDGAPPPDICQVLFGGTTEQPTAPMVQFMGRVVHALQKRCGGQTPTLAELRATVAMFSPTAAADLRVNLFNQLTQTNDTYPDTDPWDTWEPANDAYMTRPGPDEFTTWCWPGNVSTQAVTRVYKAALAADPSGRVQHMTAADNGYQVGLTGTQREALSRRVARGGAVMRMTPPSTLVMRQIVTNTPMHIYSPQYAQQLMADEWAHLAPIIDYIQNSGGARWACMLALCDLVHMDRVLSPREYRVWQVAVEHELGPDVTRDQAQQLCNAAGLANAAAAAVDLLAWCQPGLAELARHVLAPFARFCMSNMPRDVFVASAEERDMTGKPYWEHVLKFAVAAASIQDRGAPPAVDVATLGDMECATIFEQMAALCDMGTVIDGNDIPARRNALRDMYDNAGDVDQQPARLGANARLGAFAIAAIVGCLPATREVFEMLLSLGLLPSMTVAAPMSAQVHYGVQVMSSSTTAFTTDLDVRTTPGSGFTQGDLYAVAGTFGSYTYPTPLNTKAAVYVTNLSVNMRRAVLRMSGFSQLPDYDEYDPHGHPMRNLTVPTWMPLQTSSSTARDPACYTHAGLLQGTWLV